MLEITAKVAMLKLCLWPQSDKLHAFPAPQLFALLGSQGYFFWESRK